MLKRLMPCMVIGAMLGLWGTEADAGCYTSGGRRVCTTSKTGSIVLDVAFTGCDPEELEPEAPGCDAQSFSAQTSNGNIAFCENPDDPDGAPIRTECNDLVTFGGPPEECVFTPPAQRNKIPGGGAATGHKCTSSTLYEPSGGCQDECDLAAGEPTTVLDIVPIEMDTQLVVFFGGPLALAASSSTECPTDPCQIEEHCTISPNRIGFEATRTYTCVNTSVGPPPVISFENCTNEVDDDNDDLADCADPDCFSESCAPEVFCNDSGDNDVDGFTDCDDSDCVGTEGCPIPG